MASAARFPAKGVVDEETGRDPGPGRDHQPGIDVPFDFLYFESDFSAGGNVASSIANPDRTQFCGLTREQAQSVIAELSTTELGARRIRQHDGEARRPEGRPQEASAVSLPVPVTRSLRSRPPARMGGGGSEWRNRRAHATRQGRWPVDQERPLRRLDQVRVNGACLDFLLANRECPHFHRPH